MPLSKLVERILKRLEAAVVCELNPHFQTDHCIAWITVLNAARGMSDPHVSATYTVLGIHPDKVWPKIQARRHADLRDDYGNFYTPTGELLAFDVSSFESYPPRKPVQPERRMIKRGEEKAA